MKKLISTTLLAALLGVGFNVSAQTKPAEADAVRGGPTKDATTPMGMGMTMPQRQAMMKAMDVNGDGMISREEFMKYHEGMYDKMNKGSNGMVSMKDMLGGP